MPRPTRSAPRACVLSIAIACALVGATVRAQNNTCETGEAPDVIVGDIHERVRWGEDGGITAFSIGTISCNVGTCWLNWQDAPSNQHPVIGQNMFRLKDGRFEQIGQSWLKHGFNALSQELCSTGCIATTGEHLGVNCSDPYSANLNGMQFRLGPKFEVDAATGTHPHPVTDQFMTGNSIYKRLQVRNDDLDPALNSGAAYYVEAQYVAEDDSAAGNQNNNASYREVLVSGAASTFDIQLTGQTVREEPAIAAWVAADPGVTRLDVDVPGDGRFVVAARATDLGGGVWHYEYAVQNLNSHRSAMSFRVPIPFGSSPTNIGFHDVDYHSNEPFAGTDWTSQVSSTDVTWETDAFSVDPDANALRWGTLYNFRFDLDVAPEVGDVTLGLFRPGTPTDVTVGTTIPGLCDNDGTCEPGESCGNCVGDCPDTGPDGDGDARNVCIDCDDGDPNVWATPGEVLNLTLAADTLSWDPPADPGATQVSYEVLRSPDPGDFVNPVTCLPDPAPEDTTLVDGDDPLPGSAFHYLVRATNLCPQGDGPLGDATAGPRVGAACP